MRAGVDNNVWVSSVLNPGGAPAAVRRALKRGDFTLIMSRPMLEELSEVLARPRIGCVVKFTFTLVQLPQLELAQQWTGNTRRRV